MSGCPTSSAAPTATTLQRRCGKRCITTIRPASANLMYTSCARGSGGVHKKRTGAPHSTVPIGQERRRGDAHIGGYYVLVYVDTRGCTAPGRPGEGLRESGWGKAKAAPKRRPSAAKSIIR